MTTLPHQYITRETGLVMTERLFADRLVQLLYNGVRENAPALFRLLTSARMSELLACINFDMPFGRNAGRQDDFLHSCGINIAECVADPAELDTPRKVFERQIRYWECRPMTDDPGVVVSPADSRVIVASFRETSDLVVKGKFFSFDELIGDSNPEWKAAFSEGDFAVFRLTPDKYHFNHLPVSGTVIDIYEIDGAHHACNPGAVVAEATPYSKNRRVVTVIDTDVQGGTGVGLVAMVEVVALMIGNIVQCYSDDRYVAPRDVIPGLFVRRGQPKSMYRPGSSTDILLFQKGRIEFTEDLVRNRFRTDATSRFSMGFGRQLVETDLQVRSAIGKAR